MGKQSRARRAAKRRSRHAAGPGPFASRSERPDGTEAVRAALVRAARAAAAGDPAAAAGCAGALLGGSSLLAGRLVQAAASSLARELLAMLWRGGWQPQDLHQIVRRRLTAEHLRLAVDLVADEAAGYATATVDPRWLDQLGEMDAQVWWSRDATPLGAWTTRSGTHPIDVLRLGIELLGLWLSLPQLSRLLPLPGSAGVRPGRGRSRPEDAKMLTRVRSLLAKAESTDFPDEAEALSAKAQELMTRHSLARLVVETATDEREPVTARRLWIEAPYATAKALLVQTVAEANRCRAVWDDRLGVVTLVGDERDLVASELLVTSLLVQATHAMVQRGRQSHAYGHQRTRSFRQSFLVSYATRIGERLRGATETAAADVAGPDLLPVLAADSERVERARDTMFPTMSAQRVGVSSNVGWAAGRAAADLARLDCRAGLAVEEHAAS